MAQPISPPTQAIPGHLPPVLRWSIADAWAWLAHAWWNFVHAPFLGLLFLLFLAVVVLRSLGKILR